MPLGNGPDGMHVFGSGVSPCVFRVLETDSVPAAQRECDKSMPRYRLVLSRESRREFEVLRKRNPLLANVMRLPDEQPPYTQPLQLAAGPALLRNFAEDSLVLRLHGSNRDYAVLPQHDLVSCRRGSCLVAEDETTGIRLRLYRSSELDGLIAASAGEHQ